MGYGISAASRYPCRSGFDAAHNSAKKCKNVGLQTLFIPPGGGNINLIKPMENQHFCGKTCRQHTQIQCLPLDPSGSFAIFAMQGTKQKQEQNKTNRETKRNKTICGTKQYETKKKREQNKTKRESRNSATMRQNV